MSSSILISKRKNKKTHWFSWFWLGTFAFLILSIGIVLLCVDGNTILLYKHDMLEHKLERLRNPNRPPHLIVVSGSNALYSINSKVLSQETNMPVTNLAVHWGIALYAMERLAPLIKAGDKVLMPLEYTFYLEPGQTMHWEEACYRLAHDRNSIHSLKQWGDVLIRCKPKMLIGGIGLKVLSLVGFKYPRYDMTRLLNAEGDITDNIETPNPKPKNEVFGSLLMTEEWIRRDYPRLEEKIAEIKKGGAQVILSFPVYLKTKSNESLVSDTWLESLQAWSKKQGIAIVSNPNKHQFHPHCFFNGEYHLHQGCTSENARIYANELKEYFENNKQSLKK